VTTKLKIALGVGAAGAVAYWLWRKSAGGTRPVCGPGSTWHQATPDELANIGKWSLPVQESLKKWGGYCARSGFVSDASVVEGPILYPWQVE
jgi:hypothetical protein